MIAGGVARAIPAVVVLVLCTVPVGCSGGSGPDPDEGPSVESSPFLVSDVPEGYRLVRVGIGAAVPTFGHDIEGTLEPFTLLTADGTPDGADALAVSYTMGDDEAAVHVAYRDRRDRTEYPVIDGEPARFQQGTGWSDLMLKRTSDVWVRVSSDTARSQEELIAIAEEVPVPDKAGRSFAPQLEDGFAGLRVVGSVDADVLASQWALVGATGQLEPPGAHVAVLIADADTWKRIAVRTLPGRSGDIDVVGRHPFLDPRRVGVGDVDGQPTIHVATANGCQASTMATSWGDLLVAASCDLDHEELDALLGSVVQTDDAGWRGAVAGG